MAPVSSLVGPAYFYCWLGIDLRAAGTFWITLLLVQLLHFIDEVEAQKGQMSSLRSHTP